MKEYTMKKILLLTMFAAVLAGCATTTKTISTPVLQDRPTFAVPTLSAANQDSVNWIVLTKDNAAKKLAELEKTQGVVAVFAVTPRGYEALSLNSAELRRYIKQQKSIIVAMKKYYETPVGKNVNGN
jgi:hypothetical protein